MSTPPHNLEPWMFGALGTFVGFIARAKHWMRDDGSWDRRLFLGDLSAGGLVTVAAVATVMWTGIDHQYAAVIGATLMWVGLDPLREIVIKVIDRLSDKIGTDNDA